MAELVAGIVLTLADLMTAVFGWVVAKVRGYDLFDEIMREGEADTARARST
jgi:hypothetical protein